MLTLDIVFARHICAAAGDMESLVPVAPLSRHIAGLLVADLVADLVPERRRADHNAMGLHRSDDDGGKSKR